MKKKFLFLHYAFYKKQRWGRTFPLAKAAVKCGFEVTLLTIDTQKGCGYSVEILDGVRIIKCRDILPGFLLKKGIGFFVFLFRIIHCLFSTYDYVYTDCGEAIHTGGP